jgi:phosphoribosyl 1,2-cyclic phosphate phosphodiesterase
MGELIMLGSGTSHGVPMFGYDYPPGYLDNPKNHRTRSSVVLSGPTGNLLIDCSPELRLQATREGLRRFAGVLITHTHADHVMGMDDLRSQCMLTRESIPVYAWPAYQEEIRRIYAYAFAPPPVPGVELPRFELQDVPQHLEIGGMSIRTFEVRHGRFPVVGIRVGKLAYITDVSEIPDEAMEILQDLDTLILDAVRVQPHPNHFHFDRAIEVATELGAGVTYFTHLSHDYDHDVTESLLPPNLRLAYDGLRIAF